MTNLTSSTPSPESLNRLRELDWLRVLAFLILIFYHSGMLFCTWEFHIKNPQTSEVFDYIMIFFGQWRLPLLFFISGAGVRFALRARTNGVFAKERLTRLGLPILFGMLVVVSPQIYVERLTQGHTYSFFEFYAQVFTEHYLPYPAGDISWHHLWFIVYILVYSLISIPIFNVLQTPRGEVFIARLASGVERRGGLLPVIILPAILISMALVPFFPTTHNLVWDWANFTVSLYIFLTGFVMASNERFFEALKSQRRLWLGMATLTVVTLYTVVALGLNRDAAPSTRVMFFIPLQTLNGACWLFGILGFARAHLTFTNPFLRYANEAVYPFYIFHQSVMLIAGYLLLGWEINIVLKFLAICTITFSGSWLLYELMRRTSFTRLLIGLKPIPKQDRSQAKINEVASSLTATDF